MARSATRAALPWAVAVVRRLCAAADLWPSLATAEGAKVVAGAAPLPGPGLEKPLYRRLSALGGAPEGSVTRVMDEWLREGKRVRPIEVIKYVKELRKYKRFAQALELMKWMDRKGIEMTYSNHAIRVDLLSKTEGLDSAERYFSNLPEPAKNHLTYGALLNCYCTEKLADKATALYERMKLLNYDSTTLVYNNLMILYLKLHQPEKVPPLMEDMKAKNISPDNLTYCILMNSYASLKDIDAVEQVVCELEDKGAETLPWTVYSNLSSIYISAGLTEKAESALKMLEVTLDKKDRTSFHFLITLHARMGNLSEVNRIWKTMKDIFWKTTNLSYLVVLQALDRLDDLDAINQCYEEWESRYVHHDVRLTNVVLGVYLRRNLINEALSLWEAAIQKGSKSNFRTFEMFIDYYLKNLEVELALKYVYAAASKVKKEEWKLDKEKVNIFLEYFEEQMDVDGAEVFCQTLKKLNCLNSGVSD
uniref:Pentatricopeptide repeat-containing protein At4g01990, mitochondrial n=1 Tax=Anthurium amnicola TaxID=1678845 RepID=A0A1D1XML8_9ARAE